MNCAIDLDWADGTYTFRILIGGWEELRDKTGAGPLELLNRFRAGVWHAKDLREIIRVGLIGGGLAPVDALKLVRTYVDERPLLENVPVAVHVLNAGLMTPEDDEPKKADRRDEVMARSVSPISTARVQ